MKITHVTDYKPLRAAAYPSVEDQLDRLWHAMNDGTLPKVDGFYDVIKEVKDKFPKETK